jgi:hypothetical protein
MDLKECFRKGMIKKTYVDEELMDSILEMSNIKENTVRNAGINEENISVYVSMAYDSLREVLEVICISKGYKVLSHVCIGELMRDLINDFEYEEFDRFRFIRNGINYYGSRIGFSQGKDIIEKIFAMKKRLVDGHLEKIAVLKSVLR